ncbi:MAG: flagellar hook-basal body complex protein FliE [Legionellales bacterium]
MRIEALPSPFMNATSVAGIENTQSTEKTEPSFANWLGDKMIATNEQLNSADAALTQLASGHAENLHQTMLSLEQAKLSFQYLEQIRNRLMGAYQDLLREQI